MAGKYVINGAKIKCPLCTKPEGKLMVTSNLVGVQNQFWATEGDKGKPNFMFQGNCTKFPNNPPPCMGVISPIQWQNPAMGVKVDGKAPLLDSSSIMCATGGVPITIVDTKQKSTPTNLQALAESGAPVPAPAETEEPEIINAYWVDKDINKETTLDHGEKARIRIKTENALDKKIILKVYESDFGPMNDDFIWQHEWKLKNKDTVHSFNITPDMFIKGEEDLVHFYFTLQIEDEDEEEFCNSNADYLKVHLVRYVPDVMRALEWSVGAALQDEWFSRPSSATPETNTPNLSIVTMDWALGFQRLKTVYDTLIQQKIWINTDGKDALVREIKRMQIDGKISIPTIEGSSISFGVYDSNIITHKGRKITEFDKYHYQERPFDQFPLTAPLDDLTASLANTVFRLGAGGVLKKEKDGYRIEVKKVYIYLMDSFNYIDDSYPNKIRSQDLGYWKIEANDVIGLSGMIRPGYRKINNYSYNTYREEMGIGGDFNVYSDLRFINTNDSFKVSLTTF